MQQPDRPDLAQGRPQASTVILRDGSRVTLRAIRPDDAPRLQALFGRLSPESIFFRFLGQPRELSDREARRLAAVDYEAQMAWVAVPEAAPADEVPEEQIIGVARYARLQAGAGPEPQSVAGPLEAVAEAAVVVEDRWQRLGLGTMLLQALADYARDHGIDAFQATVHQTNTRILRFIRRSGLPTQDRVDGGLWEIRVSLNEE
ncbi:MAG: GNAT family N-acetyltransferase [Anaerolineae bacterium]